jgi:uncharacterized protein (TIGR00299 family) protein
VTVLYFDCFSGASGDMILGALVDAGVPFDDIRRALGSLAIDPDTVWTERVNRAGITATKFHVRGEPGAHRHEGDWHHHDHAHHPHRHLSGIYKLIDQSALSPAGKDRAKALFERLGRAVAEIHGTAMEKVHLHEVGALDSIIDIVGAVHALELIAADRIIASPLNVGHGTITSAHGEYPVPAPATVKLLKDAPIYSGPQQAELLTPTGALLISSYADSYGPVPPMRLKQAGYGAGARDFAGHPNVLRVLIGEADAATVSETLQGGASAVVVMEAEIDDMNPQIFGVVMDQLLAAGALDVFYTPIQMKKNRPGTLLSVVAPSEAREKLLAIVFRETTTIGVRYREMFREALARETVTVSTAHGPVRVKVARRNGEVVNASPEFEDCARLAAETGRPLKEIQAAAMKAWLER